MTPPSLVGQTLAHGKRVWYFTVSSFVMLSQLSQAAVGKLSIFIVRGMHEQFIQASFSAMKD